MHTAYTPKNGALTTQEKYYMVILSIELNLVQDQQSYLLRKNNSIN